MAMNLSHAQSAVRLCDVTLTVELGMEKDNLDIQVIEVRMVIYCFPNFVYAIETITAHPNLMKVWGGYKLRRTDEWLKLCSR